MYDSKYYFTAIKNAIDVDWLVSDLEAILEEIYKDGYDDGYEDGLEEGKDG